MKKVTLLTGDGIGPEIIQSVVTIFDYLKLPITFDSQLLGQKALDLTGNILPQTTIDSIQTTKIILKAPYQTAIGEGFRSVNVTLRQMFDLYANVRPAKNIPGVITPFSNVDLVIIRENTEDLYIGIEETVAQNQKVQALKVITRTASEKIIRYAFEYLKNNNRHHLTCVHKANILKETDGLFIKIFDEIAQQYPNFKVDKMIVDNAAMQMVINPQQFDVMVMPNMYGDILSDLASGLVGGLGVTPSANIGNNYALFEACHGSAPDIANQNIANPTAIILSSCLMLDYLNLNSDSDNIRQALYKVLSDPKKCPKDLKGPKTTIEFTQEIIKNLLV